MTPEERAAELCDWEEITVGDPTYWERFDEIPVPRDLEQRAAAAIKEAVLEERERCARVAAAYELEDVGQEIAARIRRPPVVWTP